MEEVSSGIVRSAHYRVDFFVNRVSFIRIIGNDCGARAQPAQMVPKSRHFFADDIGL